MQDETKIDIHRSARKFRRSIAKFESDTSIKTGARHSYAKYLLFPVKLRRQFRTDDFDFEKLSCGTVKYKDKLFIVFGAPRKGVALRPQKEAKDDEEPYYTSANGVNGKE